MVLRNSEMITLANATTNVTEIAITMAGSSLEVTARAEQIPSTWTMTGLFLLSGPNSAALVLLDNSAMFFLL